MKIHEIKEMKTEEIIQRIKDEEQSLVDLKVLSSVKAIDEHIENKKCEKRYRKVENSSSGKRITISR
ncbi:MAG: hypothetical protein MZV64_21255 [Ignavibacteriales bacterium]|nr:hypothetical protein [Ignavibacteriales bacterium]